MFFQLPRIQETDATQIIETNSVKKITETYSGYITICLGEGTFAEVDDKNLSNGQRWSFKFMQRLICGDLFPWHGGEYENILKESEE